MSTFANNNDIVFAAARRSLRASVSGLEFVQQFSQSEHWEEAQMRAKMAQMRAEMEQMRVEMALMRAENEKLKLAAGKAERELALKRAQVGPDGRAPVCEDDFVSEWKAFEYEGTEYWKNGLHQVYKSNGYILDYVGLYDLSTCKIYHDLGAPVK
jgi:alkylation response protein AidB-like acyl-CoA dehydrogenase